MIYGRRYDEKPRCQTGRCGSKTCKMAGECECCGEPGCSDCMDFQECEPEAATGYRGERLVCEGCKEKRAEEAKEEKHVSAGSTE